MSSLVSLGIVCALGNNGQDVLSNCLRGGQFLSARQDLLPQRQVMVGAVNSPLPDMTDFPVEYQSRNNQLAFAAYQQIAEVIKKLDCAPHRLAVILGTSTSGIAEGEQALAQLDAEGRLPATYHYATQEMHAPASFIASLSGATGPAYCISTACSSSAKALISARLLLDADMADVVITGGVDSLCKLTLNGFAALESVSVGVCQPFGKARDGINIGEGAALFVMQKGNSGIRLVGFGESADAYHISAPHPEGTGAYQAMHKALDMAGIVASSLGYLNLHGTGTPLNDEMESKAVNRLCSQVPCSSTKALTGHTLGAAGAIEAGICWLLMNQAETWLPANQHNGQSDPALAPINLLQSSVQVESLNYCLSNSFAFGGSNVALLLARE